MSRSTIKDPAKSKKEISCILVRHLKYFFIVWSSFINYNLRLDGSC